MPDSIHFETGFLEAAARGLRDGHERKGQPYRRPLKRDTENSIPFIVHSIGIS